MKGIKKVIADLETRNKMIKIADKLPGGWKTVEEYLSGSIASDSDDERKLRTAESRALRKKQKSRNCHIVTITFILQHHLQHLIIGFGMSSKSSFPHNTLSSPSIVKASRRTSSQTLTAATTKAPLSPLVDQIPQQPGLRAGELETGEATAPMEEISEDEAESFEDKCTFLSSLHFMHDDFDIDSHNFDFDTLRNKANVKGSLRKNLEHWHHVSANPSVIDIIENGYKIPFYTAPISNIFQNN